MHDDPAAALLQRAADDIVDVQQAPGLVRRDIALAQREDAAARDDEQCTQFRQSRDEVVGETVRQRDALRTAGRSIGERHDAHRCATRRCRCRLLQCSCLRLDIRCVRARRIPPCPDRQPIQSFGLEQLNGRGEVLLRFANPAAVQQRFQHELVSAPVERADLQPLLQEPEPLLRWIAEPVDELFEHVDVQQPEATALSAEPARELRIPIDLQSFREVAGEQRVHRLQGGEIHFLRARLQRLLQLRDVDEAIGEFECNAVTLGPHSRARLIIEHTAQLAQAPAQLAARIVRDVPQQFAESTARDRTRDSQQRDQCTHFARSGQGHLDAVPENGQRAEESQVQRRAGHEAFFLRFHAFYHAGANGVALPFWNPSKNT